MRYLRATLFLICTLIFGSAVGQINTSEYIDDSETWFGSAYIQCAGGPFYLSLDVLIEHSVIGEAPVINIEIGDIEAPRNEPMLNAIIVDPAHADLVIENVRGVFLESLSSEIDVLELKQCEGGELPSASFVTTTKSYELWLVNAYQGGCRHDRLNWMITEL